MGRGNDLGRGHRVRRDKPQAFAKAGSNPVAEAGHSAPPPPTQKPPKGSWLSNFTPKIEIAPVVSAQILAANDKRNYLHFQNNSDTDMHLGFGVSATLDSYTVPSGGFIEFNVAVPWNAIHLLCKNPNKKLVVIEGIKV